VNPRVRAVMRKEFREFRRNKLILGTTIVLPLFFMVIPLASVLGVKAGTPLSVVRSAVGGATLTLMLVPLVLPTVMAGYAVIGEREQGTLESVLTTPVLAKELLLGKALAAVVPSVAISYALALTFALLARAVATPVVVHLVWQPSQLAAILLFAPLTSTFSIWVGLAVSVRVNDIRVAQQLSFLAMLPMLGLIALFTFRVISPSVTVALAGAAILIVIDRFAWRLVTAVFDRERLLTRYGRS
jgi:ABC-type Na+ efflux pump permease subunit